MFRYQGKTALITSASSGIGEAFARELARRGMNLILVARSEERLHALSDELSRHCGIKADVIATDLSQAGAAKCVKAAVQERALTVHLLVNNAGFAVYDHFEKIDPERDHQQVMVNVSTLVDEAKQPAVS
jgi:short-subunit dehydrogenase